ncbi:MAG: tRNA pseudouridine(38-40) synthase TruA [Phycisphaerae bacterium]|nr:tRNA pseudouridine(38-40) synthase TruA [Phycisphaerae bacterium]NUQ44644.1 tRNA pseudouridine(38-40) synthase TruA [Phycisphaerae bacterium]
MRNLRMIIAYDGSEFHGWQSQPGMRTVQSILEQAVRRVVRHQVAIIGAGRTDSGVHAAGQVANFFTIRDIPARNLLRAIGSRLPKDMSLEDVRDVPLTFHATHSAMCKLYRYRVFASPRRPVTLHAQRYTYHFWHRLDIDRLRAAAAVLVGRHDFTSFASKGNDRTHNVRCILRCDVFRVGDEIRFDIEGDGFLYNQVRNIVGTLLEIGRGLWPVERMSEILAALDRTAAGPTAPARGLSLQWVRYDLRALRRSAEAQGLSGAAAADLASSFALPAGDQPVLPPGTDLEEEPSG